MATKILTALVLPPGACLLLALLGLVLLRLRRRRTGWALLLIGLLSLWVLATPTVADVLVRSIEDRVAPRAIADLPSADVIVVLGGGLSPAATPRESADLSDASDRVLHAARLFRAGKAPFVLPTGGYPAWYGDVPSEATSTTALLVEWGVPPEAVIAEDGALDTHANAVRTKGLLETRGLEHALLVTSALHMPRARATFEAAGLEVTPAPTDFLATDAGEATPLDWLPGAGALDASRRALHEHLGLLYYRLRGWAR